MNLKTTAVTYLILLKFLPLNKYNVYNYLWRYYGASIMKHFGECVKTHLQLHKLKHDLNFIRTCKREKLMPNFTRIKLANSSLNESKLIRQCRFNILQAEMKLKKKIFTQTYRHLIRLDNTLKEYVPHLIYVRLKTIIEQIVYNKMINVEQTHAIKLETLRFDNNNMNQTSPSRLNIKSVKNLSDRVLNNDEINALANGLHHVYSSGLFDQAAFVCNVEHFYAKLMNVKTNYRHYEEKQVNENVVHQLTPAQLDIACQVRSVSNMIKNKAQVELKTLGAQHKPSMDVLKRLAKDRSIIITKPDKGRGVVVMNRLDYNQKMEAILNDPLTFKTIDHDPTIAKEKKLTTLLLKLKKEKFITDHEYYLAKPTGSRPARIYGLPKLHKLNHPLRPVMSATKTVAYGLGKVLSRRLSHLRHSPYVVKDSFDFVKKINSSEHTDKIMVSFDVVSLFTKIPLTYTLNLILDRLYPGCENKCYLKKKNNREIKLCNPCQQRENFKELLCTATSDVNFLFNNKMYQQHNGVAMGAPIAPIVADIFMAHLEITLMEDLKNNGIYEWYRFVDDTFVLIDPKTNIKDVLAILNNFHESIQFTHEMEKDNCISFLDVKVCRLPTKSKFETRIYRKSTYTGLMINWFSYVPMQFKKASIVNMIQRALKICSNYKFLVSEFDHIRKIAKANLYPVTFIEQRIAIGLSQYLHNQVKKEKLPVIGCEKEQMYFELPFLGKTTDVLKKNLKCIINKYRPSLNPHFYVKSPTSIQTLFKTKDSINKFMQSDIVYRIKCNDCQQTYVGKTERQMITRILEHGAPKQLLQEVIHNSQTENIKNHETDGSHAITNINNLHQTTANNPEPIEDVNNVYQPDQLKHENHYPVTKSQLIEDFNNPTRNTLNKSKQKRQLKQIKDSEDQQHDNNHSIINNEDSTLKPLINSNRRIKFKEQDDPDEDQDDNDHIMLNNHSLINIKNPTIKSLINSNKTNKVKEKYESDDQQHDNNHSIKNDEDSTLKPLINSNRRIKFKEQDDLDDERDDIEFLILNSHSIINVKDPTVGSLINLNKGIKFKGNDGRDDQKRDNNHLVVNVENPTINTLNESKQGSKWKQIKNPGQHDDNVHLIHNNYSIINDEDSTLKPLINSNRGIKFKEQDDPDEDHDDNDHIILNNHSIINIENPIIKSLINSNERIKIKEKDDPDDQQHNNNHSKRNDEDSTLKPLITSCRRNRFKEQEDSDDEQDKKPLINSNKRIKFKEKEKDDPDDQQHDNIHSIVNVENPAVNTLNKSKQTSQFNKIKDPNNKHDDNGHLILINHTIKNVGNAATNGFNNSSSVFKINQAKGYDDQHDDDNNHSIINVKNPTIKPLTHSNKRIKFKGKDDSDDQQQDINHTIINVEYPTVNTVNKSKQKGRLKQIKDPVDQHEHNVHSVLNNHSIINTLNESNRGIKSNEKDHPDDHQHDNTRSIINVENPTSNLVNKSKQINQLKQIKDPDDKHDSNVHFNRNNSSILNIKNPLINTSNESNPIINTSNESNPIINTLNKSNRRIKFKEKGKDNPDDQQQDNYHSLINSKIPTTNTLNKSNRRIKSKEKEVPDDKHDDNDRLILNNQSIINVENPRSNLVNKSKQINLLKQIKDPDDKHDSNVHFNRNNSSILNIKNPIINTSNESNPIINTSNESNPIINTSNESNPIINTLNKSNRRIKFKEKGKDNPDDQQQDNYHSLINSKNPTTNTLNKSNRRIKSKEKEVPDDKHDDNDRLILKNQSIIDVENSTMEPIINLNRGIKFKGSENSDVKQDDNGHLMNVNLRRSDRIKKIQLNKGEILNYSENTKWNITEVNITTNNTNDFNGINVKEQHKSESNENKVKCKNSAISKHEKECNHKMDWRSSQVVWSDNTSHKLLIKESLIIKAYEPELNRTTHSVPLYVFPEGLRKQYLPKFPL